MGYNATAPYENVTRTDYVDNGKCQDRFGPFFWSKTESNYLYVKRRVSKRDNNTDFCLVQNLTVGDEVFNPFMQ